MEPGSEPTMRPGRFQLVALTTLVASALLAGSAWAKPPRFRGWTPLSDYVSAGLVEGGSFRLVLPTRAGETEIALRPVAVEAPGYRAEEAVAGGERRGQRRARVRTFAGSIESAGTPGPRRRGRGGDFARLALEPNGRLSGLLRVDGVLYDLSADTAAGDLVLAVNEIDPEELAAAFAACGVDADEALAAGASGESGAGTTTAPPSAGAGALHEIELGTEADAPFVAQTGGVAEANARILSIVNSINGIYEYDLGLTNRVVFQRGWNGSDPYTSSNSDTLLTQFRGNFLANVASPTDDAQLFSGRDFDGTTVGRAYVAAACTSYRFGVNQFYQQSDSLTRLIAAHEMGHNFGASHTTDGIMAPSINPSVTWFSQTSQNEIGNYVAALSCLGEINMGGAPVLDPIGPQDAPENTMLSLQLSASDPDGDPISWSALPLPVGASLSANGLFRWTPPLDAVGCGGFLERPVTFYARDSHGNQASETVMISVLDAPTGAPPAIVDPADRSVLSEQALVIPISASDPDGDTLSFASMSLPAGAKLSPAGVFSWTPSETQVGVHGVGFTVTDCTGASAGGSFSVEVASSAPQLTSLSAASGDKGDEITLYGEHLAGKKVRVYFGPKKGKTLSVSDTSVVVRVPKKKKKLPDTLSLSVLRDGVASSNSLPFTYTPPAP
jgi:Metallo-peptidase family M12/Putative Ig domain/IPT/TIG domain